MIRAYVPDEAQISELVVDAGTVPADAVWIDVLNPSREEELAIETLCAIEMPTREEMREIEVSSRLYAEDGATFMTASVVFGLDGGKPGFAPITFILVGQRLVTLRYSEPKSFALYAAKLCRETPRATPDETEKPSAGNGRQHTAETILIGLLETVVDRVADLLETVSADLDGIGDDIFSSSERKKPTKTGDFKVLLRRIGAAGDLTSRIRESLATFGRLVPFLQVTLDGRKSLARDAKPRVKAMARDIQSLNDFVSFLSNKTVFLLDTTVGMISIEQAGIIKIFSVAAVAFLPPTLIASVYGMNFEHMPELSWPYGYPFAIILMIVSAVVPMLFFRIKNWL